MKPVLVVVLAAGFANRPRFVRCLPAIGFAAACCAILLSERDLGAVLLYFLTTVLMYYAATSNALLTLAGLGMGCAAAVIAYHAFPYVQDRIAIWLNPWSDPQGTGYQLVQALIAIGSGGLFGMGLGLGSPTQHPAVPFGLHLRLHGGGVRADLRGVRAGGVRRHRPARPDRGDERAHELPLADGVRAGRAAGTCRRC